MLGAAEHQLAIIHDPGTQTVCQPLVDGGRIIHQPEGKRPLSINDMGELGPDVGIESTGLIAVLAEAISAVLVSMGRSTTW